MANPEHLAVVRQGADAIAEWRRSHPDTGLDLFGADLFGANLFGANLTRANLTEADLTEADLTRAILTEAILIRAILTEAILTRANLTRADLIGDNLTRVNLFGANLFGANLTMANLTGAFLIGANLTMANLSGANLTGADLIGAFLTGAFLTRADLTGANLFGVSCFYTVFGDCDLSQAVGLDEVQHEGPSTIGMDTIIRTARSQGGKLSPQVRSFFTGAGVPEPALGAILASIREIRYRSCFISYGSPDGEFAEKLRGNLEEVVGRGQVWMYQMDKTVGVPTWEEIERMLDRHERVIVTCSLGSLSRDGVKREIKTIVDKAPSKLMPVSLDSEWTDLDRIEYQGVDLKPYLTRLNYTSFTGWEKDKPRYQRGVEELLKGLEREREPQDS